PEAALYQLITNKLKPPPWTLAEDHFAVGRASQRNARNQKSKPLATASRNPRSRPRRFTVSHHRATKLAEARKKREVYELRRARQVGPQEGPQVLHLPLPPFMGDPLAATGRLRRRCKNGWMVEKNR